MLKIYDFNTSPDVVEQRLVAVLSEYRDFVDARLSQGSPYTWGNLVLPMEELDARIQEIWSPFDHRNSVVNDEATRDAYARCQKLRSGFAADMGQNKELLEAYEELARETLPDEQRKAASNALRDFHLAGVDLSTGKKARYKEIVERLSTLQSDFQNNLIDAAKHWKKHITDEKELVGLPESTIAGMKEAAEADGLPGYVVLLEQDKYRAIMENATNRTLRQEFYEAWLTRASDREPHAGKRDNAPLYEEILALRHEQALLLGFKNYAELSLATKMADSTGEVLGFLDRLAERAKPFALREHQELSAFAKKRDGVETLELWDIGYYVEQIKEEKFSVSAKEVREYFPLPKVLAGMFAIADKLYGIRLEERFGINLWHPDARFFEVSKSGELIGGLYMDLYARKNKRGSAWVDVAVSRRQTLDGSVVLPVAYLEHTIESPVDDAVALLSYDEVLTLFHEFGHGLHILLTQIEIATISGINGVEWDAVELPSQFMENFAWTREGIDLISGHYKTGERLPDAIFRKMLDARNFGAGLATMRQLAFGIFDLRLYREYGFGKSADVLRLWREVFTECLPMPFPEWNRFPNTFAHIFTDGYGAGYYGYMWALVLACDAFGAFVQEDGAIDWSVGEKFLKSLLSRGGSRAMMENFVEFRGQKPSVDALLRHYGFIE
ncbi:MAG: M3 family metallopeptidase [Parcubacteria group bacterium]|nr:M3 family metallopeptidase [Parcubacteria group bacterium]